MKAIVYSTYGSPDVLKLEETDKPTPNTDEVLIKVRAAALNPLDWHVMRGMPYLLRLMTGLRKPKVARLGFDVAGQVEAVGRNVTQFRPGDEVFGSCRGAFVEYACTSESKLALKPDNLTFEQAAATPGAALTALQALRDKGRIQAGQEVLINGAAGGVGTFAVQLAKWFGAEVTGVCSTRNVELVRTLGADRVTDYSQEDFTNSPRSYDLILDNVGNHSFSACRRVLTSNGVCVMVGGPNEGHWIGPLAGALKALVWSWFVSQKFVMFITKPSKEGLNILRELLAAGKVTPVIDRRYSLSEVPEAIRYLEKGHTQGKVVITIP